MIRKIVILGPESTGKSSLCAQLAEHYQTEWVREYAREYLLTNGTAYTYEELLDIARGQLALEDEAMERLGKFNNAITTRPTPLFIDTNMHVLEVWCEFVFGKCHPFVLNQVVERSYHLYLLCDIDLPWVKDELREYPDLETRKKLYWHYKDMMVNQHVPWVNINGNYKERIEKAIKAVDGLLSAGMPD